MNTATAAKKAPAARKGAAPKLAPKAATKVVARPEQKAAAKPTPAERAARTAKRIADEILASSTPQAAFEEAAVAVLTGKRAKATPAVEAGMTTLVGKSPEQMDRLERLAAAKHENAALKAWKAAGSKGAKPATPTIDWMSSVPAAERKTSKSSSTGSKGAPQKMSDAEVRAWVLAQRKAEQSSTLATFRAAGHSCAAARFAEIRKAALS